MKKFILILVALITLVVFSSCSTAVRAMMNLSAMQAGTYFKNPIEVEFCHAIEWGNTNRMREILSNGLDINTRGKVDKMSFLMWSFLKQNKTSYQFLLENGANPNQMSWSSHRMHYYSVIAVTVIPEDPFWLEEALKHGGDPNGEFEEYQSIIFDAVEHERVENIKLLLKYGADINFQDKASKKTPLIDAISGFQYKMAYNLLELGADPQVNKKKLLLLMDDPIVLYPHGDMKEERAYRRKLVEKLNTMGFQFTNPE